LITYNVSKKHNLGAQAVTQLCLLYHPSPNTRHARTFQCQLSYALLAAQILHCPLMLRPGTLARCATAFNVRQVCLVGSRHFNTFGAHGASDYVDFCHYRTLDECCQDLKENKGASMAGGVGCDEEWKTWAAHAVWCADWRCFRAGL
jgi:hypothetical protein